MFWQQVKSWITGQRQSTAYSNSSSNNPQQRSPLPSCDLYDLVLDLNWDRVIQHCQEHPHDAAFQDFDTSESPLYLACQWSPPLAAIQALIAANPKALSWTSREHRDVPLHSICRYPTTSVEVLQAFVEPDPSTALLPTKYGKTSLQVLWQFARPECIKENRVPALDEEQEQVDIFWAKMNLLVDAVAKSRQESWPRRAEDATSHHRSTSRETEGQEDDENDETDSSSSPYLYRVHAVVSLGALGCPCEVLEYVVQKYPHQLSQRDESGQLPLHIAVGPSQWSPNGKRKYKPREQEIVQMLLKHYPQAAQRRLFSVWDYYPYLLPGGSSASSTTTTSSIQNMDESSSHHHYSHLPKRQRQQQEQQEQERPTMDRKGRYPLHVALANRHTWAGGVQDLFQAAPELLSVRDPVTQLLPFQLAAVPVRNNLTVDITTIWELLRHQPEQLSLS